MMPSTPISDQRLHVQFVIYGPDDHLKVEFLCLLHLCRVDIAKKTVTRTAPPAGLDQAGHAAGMCIDVKSCSPGRRLLAWLADIVEPVLLRGKIDRRNLRRDALDDLQGSPVK